MESNSYQFTSMRGVQAGRAYYVLMCPLKLVPKLFRFDDEALPPDLRAQRVLNRTRVPQIARYMVDNSDEYILSSLCASVDGELEFEPVAQTGPMRSIGLLRIGMSSTILINDGQHRRAAIEEAVLERPELGDESISVVLFADGGLQRSQQMFADLNVHAIRPTKSIRLLYDHRDEMTKLVRDMLQEIPLFREFTDLEKSSISHRSLKLLTLSSLYQATVLFLGKSRNERIVEGDLAKAVEFWEAVIGQMPDWQRVQEREVLAHELRRGYVHAHGIALQAIGLAGARLMAEYPNDWRKRLSGLRKIDWSRSNTELWEGRALVAGKINKSTQNIVLVCNVILEALGLPSSSESAKLEVRARPLRQTSKPKERKAGKR